MYLARVCCTIDSGNGGGGLFLSQLVPIKYSRTNCLSKDSWERPGVQLSAGQNRELSGVNTSSIKITRFSDQPHSSLVATLGRRCSFCCFFLCGEFRRLRIQYFPGRKSFRLGSGLLEYFGQDEHFDP